MKNLASSPEFYYLSPTTRERALVLAEELIKQGKSTREAISLAVLTAKNWAVKNINRKVWKTLRKIDRHL